VTGVVAQFWLVGGWNESTPPSVAPATVPLAARVTPARTNVNVPLAEYVTPLYRYLATNLPVPEPAAQSSPGPFVPYAPKRTSGVDVVTGRPLKVEPAWQISLPPVARKVPLLGVTVMPGESFTGVFTSHVALVVPAAPAWGAAANPTSVAAAPTMAT